jgi:hypothetical protein
MVYLPTKLGDYIWGKWGKWEYSIHAPCFGANVGTYSIHRAYGNII